MTRHKILLADDERIARTQVATWLETWGYDVVLATDGQEALDRLKADPSIRLALLDWIMPRIDGVDVCRKLRAGPNEPYVYLVLLTARDDKEFIVEGLEAGADDYLAKPADPLELKVRLRAGTRLIELQQQLTAARDAMRFEAMHDALTGLVNRGALLKDLDAELERSMRVQVSTSVLFVDLDHFKKVNDTYGHAAGDAVLREVAKRLGQGIRSYDKVGRLGGEEFLVLLPECDGRLSTIVAERLRRMVCSTPVVVGGTQIACTVSIGAAGTDQMARANGPQLLEAADKALYRAKSSGRNRVILAIAADWPADVCAGDAVTLSPKRPSKTT